MAKKITFCVSRASKHYKYMADYVLFADLLKARMIITQKTLFCCSAHFFTGSDVNFCWMIQRQKVPGVAECSPPPLV